MDTVEFEGLLDKCCSILTEEARRKKFKTSLAFENRVREVLAALAQGRFKIDFNPHPQAFPDIELGEYGIWVKFTLADTWRGAAGSVL